MFQAHPSRWQASPAPGASQVEARAAALGLEPLQVLMPSRKSFAELVRRGRPVEVPADARDEFLVSTAGVVVVVHTLLSTSGAQPASAQIGCGQSRAQTGFFHWRLS